MKSLASGVVVVLLFFVVVSGHHAMAQQASPKDSGRLTAEVFAPPLFSEGVYRAAIKADEVAVRAAIFHKIAEKILDSAEAELETAMADKAMSADDFTKILTDFVNAARQFIRPSEDLLAADIRVVSLYYGMSQDILTPETEEIFKKWFDAATLSHEMDQGALLVLDAQVRRGIDHWAKLSGKGGNEWRVPKGVVVM